MIKGVTSKEQEGWLSPTERASVSAISLRHILASPGYARGTIAVNVTWMERGFNAGQRHSRYTHLSSTVYELQRDIGRKLQLFSYPLAFNVPFGVFPLEFREKFGLHKTRIMRLPGSEDNLTID